MARNAESPTAMAGLMKSTPWNLELPAALAGLHHPTPETPTAGSQGQAYRSMLENVESPAVVAGLYPRENVEGPDQ
ncbi:hypothetical protein, partial [Herbidospora cretacea]|uniref:hypothetical protein n=1 Tax=Herbidospora cretacea TaxID=28444 RepID=UPI001C3F1F81